MRKLILALLLGVALATPAHADAKFEAFIQALWPQVKAAGFSRELFDAAFKGINDPDPLVTKLADNQPEFKSTTSEYLDKTVTPARIDQGKAKLAENDALLNAIAAKYGVDKYALLGIWGIESNYGRDMGSMSVMRSLATLMFYGNKKQYAREQLIAAFTILKRGRSSGTYAKDEISRDQLLNLMAGGKELVDLEQEIAKLNGGKARAPETRH